MEKTSAQKTLKVLSVIMVVLAIITIVMGALALGAGSMLASFGGTQALESTELTAEAAGVVAVGLGFIILISGVIDLIIGCLGIRGANNPNKVGAFRVFTIIGIVLSALSLAYSVWNGIQNGHVVSEYISEVVNLALIAWCYWLATKIQNQ